MGPKFQSGGDRPDITVHPAQAISFPSSYPAGSIVIDHQGPAAVAGPVVERGAALPDLGRPRGLQLERHAKTSAAWRSGPTGIRPRRCASATRSLPEKMTGGVRNPLGAKALYLGNSLYRIHGTNDAKSIGRAASSGCFRMLNGHVVDLAGRVDVGTPVTVVHRLPPELERTVAEQVSPDRERVGARYGRSY